MQRIPGGPSSPKKSATMTWEVSGFSMEIGILALIRLQMSNVEIRTLSIEIQPVLSSDHLRTERNTSASFTEEN
jgi:hypothetical protein